MENKNQAGESTNENTFNGFVIDENDLSYEPIEEIKKTDRTYSQDDYRRRGFHAVIKEKYDHYKILDELHRNVENECKDSVNFLNNLYKLREDNLNEKIEIISAKIIEIESKIANYKIVLENLANEKIDVTIKLIEHKQKLIDIIKLIGKEKHKIIEKRINELDSELNALINMHHKAEDKQNSRFIDKSKNLNQERIDFLKNLKLDYEGSFDNVKLRIKSFDKSGISLVLANWLVSIGALGAIVAGWFFSIWTGPIPERNELGNIINNNSILFFIIDQFTKFTLRFNRNDLIIGIILFFVIMFVISWACYKLLIYFKFIDDPLKSKGQKVNETEFELELSNQDDFFKSQFKGNSWLSFWLKITPFLFFITILLVILGRVSIQNENKLLEIKSKDQLQEMFDSLVNQNFGTMICALISGLVFLYVIKVIEPRHVIALNSNDDSTIEKASGNWELISTFFLFAILLILFLLFHSQLQIFVDQRKIFLLGFFITSLCSGFCLSYGLRYRELIANYEFLERQLFRLVEFIYRISKPISYLENQYFQERISDLQKSMLKMIEKRNKLTMFLIDNKEEDTKNEDTNESVLLMPLKSAKAYLAYVWQLSLPIRKWFMSLIRKKIDKIINNELFTDEEKAYYPEIVAEVEQLQLAIGNYTQRLNEIIKLEDSYWRNEGLNKLIQNQLSKRHRAIAQIKEYMERDLTQKQIEIATINENCDKQKDLLIEGFNTGIWYLKHGDDLREFILSP